MRYSFAILAAFVGAAVATPALAPSAPSTVLPVSEFTDGQPQVPMSTPAVTPISSAAAAGTTTEVVLTTEEITIYSCAPTVSNCPARVTTTTYAVSSPTVAPMSIPMATSTSTMTISFVTPPAIPSSSPVAIPATSSSIPAVVPTSTNAAVPATSAAPSVSVITISTCIPTTILSTVTVPAVPVTSTNAAIPASSAGPSVFSSFTSMPVGTGAPSGSGVTGPMPTTSPITPFQGSASSFGISMVGAGMAAVAAIFLA
ncbi:hypothetical protein MMC26_003677 [Xylographa opegraphella]|nr:hypothetical protein [Xylographa opegraphella]